MHTDPDGERLPPRRDLQLLLPDHHRRVEAQSRELLASAYADDPRALVARWTALETELLDHIAAEEAMILPGYAQHAPDDAKQILADHARLREIVTPLGVEIELHEARAARLRSLVEALVAHAAHEEATMYPWARLHLPQPARRSLFARIARWFAGS